MEVLVVVLVVTVIVLIGFYIYSRNRGRYKKLFNTLICSIWSLICLAIIVSGFLIIAYQVYFWLKNGEWTELPLIFIIALFLKDNFFYPWLNNPQSWYGLHKAIVWILETVPLSLFFIGGGFLLLMIDIGQSDELGEN